MTSEEQDQLYGRLMRQSQESYRRLAALEAKIQALRSQLVEVAEVLTGFTAREVANPSESLQRTIGVAQQMPERQEFLDTLRS
jgi:flagellar biosynthesis chaperone FliJ